MEKDTYADNVCHDLMFEGALTLCHEVPRSVGTPPVVPVGFKGCLVGF